MRVSLDSEWRLFQLHPSKTSKDDGKIAYFPFSTYIYIYIYINETGHNFVMPCGIHLKATMQDCYAMSKFHPTCIEMTPEEAKRLDHFFCQSCSSEEQRNFLEHNKTKPSNRQMVKACNSYHLLQLSCQVISKIE
ncbi:hypothetical protein LguiB_022291 [Lonicera macranthoides]